MYIIAYLIVSLLCDYPCLTSFSHFTVQYKKGLHDHPCRHDAQLNRKLDHCALIARALMSLSKSAGGCCTCHGTREWTVGRLENCHCITNLDE